MVSAGHLPKTEASYDNVVIRLIGEMREAGEMPWDWITDSTRWMRKPTSYSSLEAAAIDAARTYRRDLWQNQNVHLEIWCEKMALLGVIGEVTDRWDVPLMIARGFSSKDFCYSAAQSIVVDDKPAFIYQVGDHDPSGIKAWQSVERNIFRYVGLIDSEFEHDMIFERIAVTPEQIEEYNLPTRPTKRNGNSHARGFKGDSVEADALPPDILRGLVEKYITQHVDMEALRVVQVAEESERKALKLFAAKTRSKIA